MPARTCAYVESGFLPVSDMASSAAHTLADVNELIAITLSFLDNRSLAASARVCKKWKEIALDFLWREVDDLHRLFTTLSPYRKPMKKLDGGRTIQSYVSHELAAM